MMKLRKKKWQNWKKKRGWIEKKKEEENEEA
jgi:hypothetical protein